MDPTVVAIPGYFATMGAEYVYLKRRAEREGPSPADYERNDTLTSLAMGVGSLLAPLVVPRLLDPFVPGRGRFGKALVASAVGATAVTVVADRLARLDPDDARLDRGDDEQPASPTSTAAQPTDAQSTDARRADGPTGEPREGAPASVTTGASGLARRLGRRRRVARAARRVAEVGGVTAVATGGVAITSLWASRTAMNRLWERRLTDLGTGPLAWTAAIVGWDFIYYWNHRFMHTSRYMWAIHVVHHSSERYNLSTALRQPVADALGTFAPYGALALLGVRPELILQARGWNLLYQYWIHTDVIRRLGPLEEVLNTPSHHRVHHGSNHHYLDRNHGSILIIWDRLFGTFQREDEPVVYGLTKNINTFNLAKVAAHEYVDMGHDVAGSRTWRDRLSFVLRGPGWAYQRHAERDAAAAQLTTAA